MMLYLLACGDLGSINKWQRIYRNSVLTRVVSKIRLVVKELALRGALTIQVTQGFQLLPICSVGCIASPESKKIK